MPSDILLQVQNLCAQLAQATRSLDGQTEALKASDHVTVIRHFDEVSKAYDILDATKKELNAIYDRLSRDYVPEAMRAAGVKTTTVEGIGRVTVSHRYSCSMLDKVRGYNWLTENGHGDLITQTVNSSTLSAFAKNLIVEEGKELPDDLFRTGTSPFTSITRK